MAKKELTEAQKEARKERARKRREARKALAGETPKAPRQKKEKKTKTAKAITDTPAPRGKKVKKDEIKPDIVIFSSIDTLKNHCYERFADNDNYKTVYYIVKTITGNNAMRGLFCKIDGDGKIDPTEYKKLENAEKENGFIGFVKEATFVKANN